MDGSIGSVTLLSLVPGGEDNGHAPSINAGDNGVVIAGPIVVQPRTVATADGPGVLRDVDAVIVDGDVMVRCGHLPVEGDEISAGRNAAPLAGLATIGLAQRPRAAQNAGDVGGVVDILLLGRERLGGY